MKVKKGVCKRCEKIAEQVEEMGLCLDCYRLLKRPRLIEVPDLPHKTNNKPVYFVDDLYAWDWDLWGW